MNDTAAPTANTSPPPPPARRGRRIAAVLLLAGSAAAAGFLGWKLHRPGTPGAPVQTSALALDLAAPDALIESASLAQLPRDLLRVPLLRDTLTEDFVFYYQSNADRLGIAGTLRRIAYEHQLELRDTIIRELLDQPAQVALWRGDDGKLKHLLLVLQRGALARLLEPLAQAALDDKQLTRAGELHAGEATVTLMRLRYAPDRSLLFASFGDRLLVLSSPGMVLENDEAGAGLARPAVAVLEKLLAGGETPFAARFGLKERAVSHRLTVSADYLAFGYRAFFPTLAGLRFDMDANGWQSFLALDGRDGGRSLDFAPLWKAMPMGASACTGLPVTAQAMKPLLDRFVGAQKMDAALAAKLTGPAAICWYGKSHLHTPLIAARLDGNATPELDAALGNAFEAFVGGEAQAPEGGTNPESPMWQHTVPSSFGNYAPPAAPEAESDAPTPSGSFRVTLARHGDTLLFSLDDQLVTDALAALDKRFPPLADQLPADRRVPAYLSPASLAELLERETLASLPEELEQVFRNAAEQSLLPKLRAMGRYGSYSLTLPADARPSGDWTWLPLQWAQR